ncbi:MAG: L-lactate dehydrogenase [Mycoplasmoidaceae bacterium]
MKRKKIILIGAGNVGCSFLYSALNNMIADEYILIDYFKELAEGQAMDLLDATGVLAYADATIRAGTYKDCDDADLIAITAGRPQKPGETRLEMIQDNAKIMKEIAKQIKATKFDGVTMISSNPVDVLTMVYQKVTGYDKHKVFGTGTMLDTSRFRVLVGKALGVNPSVVNLSIMGEHGDSSIATIEHGAIFTKPISHVIKDGKISKKQLEDIHHDVVQRAYEIINRKRATYYGIGACMMRLASHVLTDNNAIETISVYLNGEYENKGLYIGVPAIINKNGWTKIVSVPLSKKEQNNFNKSCETIKENFKSIK